MREYDHKEIEAKWQKDWAEKKIYESKDNADKPKSYVLDMFPYPSGEGLHVGHPKGYIATDVYSRLMRMKGHNVLHPMGWDAFGLPAENYALKTKTHPRQAVEKNIARYKEQLSVLGFDYDWSREINTTDPEYYKWTQWIFLKLYEKGLAYESHEPINWCPSCQTGLANEDVENDGTCERCGSQVEKRRLRQWVLKITDYADRLLQDLEKLPRWPEHIKEQQRNWIGRSEGALISFKLKASSLEISDIEVFTTRADTLFGATYLVVAPENQWLQQEVRNPKSEILNKSEIDKYLNNTKSKTEIERTDNKKEKTGVELKGIKAINPATGEEIPVWVADYVLGNYGTGAVMAVPAHDERDFEFAKKFDLPIKPVVIPIMIDESNPHVPNKKVVFRDAIIAVVKNPKTDKYLCLKWKKQPWTTFVMGGMEDGEDPVTAAQREILEETGYKNTKFIKRLHLTQSEFFATHKDVNRIAHTRSLLFELTDEATEAVAPEEQEIHEATWLSLDEIKQTDMTHIETPLILENIVGEVQAYTDEGVLFDSGEFTRLSSPEARQKITGKFGKSVTTYRLQDWVFSRQRYWGEPIPIIHCEKCGAVPIPEADLPVKLPEVEHYEPTGTGESPLANINDWVNVSCPKCDGPAKRETNTMPQWAGSSWYYLRYIDPKNNKVLVDGKKEKYWAPVDLYVGGAEHATRHLIYARFWHKFLFDLGTVSTEEPFSELHSVGLILAEDGRKMSKRWGNVINPDDIVDKFGADTMRVYEMFMGPFENAIAWSVVGLVGARRFVERIWKLSEILTDTDVPELNQKLHLTIKKVGEDIPAFKFNTAISQMMTFLNEVTKAGKIGRDQFGILVRLLAPFAPHLAEELWSDLGNKNSIHLKKWPEWNKDLVVEETITIVVQINGKVRDSFEADQNVGDDEAKAQAQELPKIKERLEKESGEVAKVIYVPKKLINIVTK